MEVEKGFWEVYSATRHRVISAVRHLANVHNATGVVITGHSLGAATASLLAFELGRAIASDPRDVALITTLQLVTFGSPRVGNRAFVEAFGGLPEGSLHRTGWSTRWI